MERHSVSLPAAVNVNSLEDKMKVFLTVDLGVLELDNFGLGNTRLSTLDSARKCTWAPQFQNKRNFGWVQKLESKVKVQR